MNTAACCRAGATPVKGRPGRLRRSGAFIRGIIPGVILVLVPKCPLCLAAYISFATGIGISFTTAWWLRTGLIICCVAALVFFLIGRLRRAG